MNKLIFSHGGKSHFSGAPRGAKVIELRQQRKDCFSVRYGASIRENLNYGSAANELGAAIMHWEALNANLK